MILTVSDQARRDIDAQIDWLAKRSPASAERALDAILSTFDLLQDFPLLGNETERGWREKKVEFGRDGYVICYVVRPADLFVVRFFHPRQDRGETGVES
ncbi:type II toxin-antitoxin system RelE/ParE family toxin [Brevundimonas aurifodinae]|uniref:Type II toxin-antitoxin system RelE/ParE family toxin n=1 Tax=Brevundimonas aurifodinae TaxID=1508312 RepID=A0ABV1NPV0_9CAUL